MSSGLSRFAVLIFAFVSIGFMMNGCAHDGCNNVPQRPTPTPSPTPCESPPCATPIPSPSSDSTNRVDDKLKTLMDPAEGPQVKVYKASGEKQCGQSVGVGIQAMAKTLMNRHVYIIESHSQPDGLMHMAVCGAPTGKIHVFTIIKKDLKRAEKLGFKVFAPHD